MATPSHPAPLTDLQNSYGPEMAHTSHGPELATAEHQSSYGPQAVPAGGLEAMNPRQQFAASGYSSYAEQAEKNNNYAGEAAAPAKKRFLGLPMWGVWLLVAKAIVVLGVALGVGLGVGLSQRSSSSGSSSSSSSSASATPSSSSPPSSTTAPISATTATPTSSTASTTTSSTTSSSTSAVATGASVEICQNAYLDSCTTISVPASSCMNFPSAYNDSISSVDTGGPTCLFYTDSSCTGDYWSTSGSQSLIPGAFNDAFSSVTCD